MILKQNNPYYYQVQGQLQISKKKFCYFPVWPPHGMLVQKVTQTPNISMFL